VNDHRIEFWQSETELASVEFAGYWNDVEEERRKEWWIADGDFAKMEAYLDEQELNAQLDRVVEVAESLGRPIRGQGADLAAGNLWAVPRLLAHGASRVYAVEYSRHRLLELGPMVLHHYSVPPTAVVLCHGSFYDLRLPDASLDFAFMSQAFHHAADPNAFLREVRRALRGDGVVLMIGEHVVDRSLPARIRNAGVALASRVPARMQSTVFGRTIARRPFRLERPAPDPVLGDHYYLSSEYRAMFAAAGFAATSVRDRAWPFQAFVLTPT
jgi:SAM-dependent methyltransferase